MKLKELLDFLSILNMVFITIYKPLARGKKGTIKENCRPGQRKGKTTTGFFRLAAQVFLPARFQKRLRLHPLLSPSCDVLRQHLGKYQDTQHVDYYDPVWFLPHLMNMVLICETQKATFVLLKAAFHMLNEVKGFQLNKNINKSFFYHDGIHKTVFCM